MSAENTKTYIEKASLVSPYGDGLSCAFEALKAYKPCCKPISIQTWPRKVKELLNFEERVQAYASLLPEDFLSDFEKFKFYFSSLVQQLDLSAVQDSFDVIVTSTKFHHEDYIWKDQEIDFSEEKNKVENFIKEALPLASRFYFVSNACSSGVVALNLSRKLLQEKEGRVLVVSYDFVGPFVYSGFLSLGALAPESSKPLSQNRKGLHLGEAFVGLLLSSQKTEVELKGAEFINDGASAIRPTHVLEVLPQLYEKMNLDQDPDLILAHATGTKHNDSFEMKALYRAYPKVSVTATKWAFGHSLASSALVDTCMAYESLLRQEVFGVNIPHDDLDSNFQNSFVMEAGAQKIKGVLVESLGFGGVTAGLSLEKVS